LISFLSQQTANLRSFEDFISCCTAGAEHVIADLVIFLFSTLRKKLRLEIIHASRRVTWYFKWIYPVH